MAGPSQPFAKPLAWWGIIQESATRGATTSELWSAIHTYSEANGIAEPPGLFREVNSLRSAATQLRNTGRALMGAPQDAAITSDYIGPLPYSRPGASQAVAQRYLARIGYDVLTGGELSTQYVTLDYSGSNLPATVGELRAEFDDAMDSYADHYGQAAVGVTSVQIGAY